MFLFSLLFALASIASLVFSNIHNDATNFLASHVNQGKLYEYGLARNDLDIQQNNCMYDTNDDTDEERYTKCSKGSPCSAVKVYSIERNGDWKLTKQKLGCGLNISIDSIHNNCSSFACSLNKLKKWSNDSRKYFFCCCHGFLCNSASKHSLAQLPATQTVPETSSTMILTTVISSVTFLVIVFCLCIVYIWKQVEKRNKANHQNLHFQTHLISMTKTLSEETLDHILRGNLIHQGCHSAVRLGTIHRKPVAVKVFPPRSKLQWLNEKEIYGLLGDHPNIAKFITSEQVPQEFGFEGIVVMSHYTEGSLLNFLRNYTLSWKHMVRLAYCISNGLAYLHGDTKKDGSSKVSIAHRDLNSRNVLVKADGTCVIADFGFALRLSGKYLNGKFPVVGSPRYMAPEVLDGSIIQSDWIAAFKQVDCYGLGLLLWELCKRCHEIIQPDCIVPECLLPYEQELGSGPSINKVCHYVCERQLRPIFPSNWKKDDFTLSYLKQTIVECWDHDGDARLTPLCVLNRLKQMEDFDGTEKNIYKETLSEDIEIFCGEVDTQCGDDETNSEYADYADSRGSRFTTSAQIKNTASHIFEEC